MRYADANFINFQLQNFIYYTLMRNCCDEMISRPAKQESITYFFNISKTEDTVNVTNFVQNVSFCLILIERYKEMNQG